ncbi:MAG: hypothetical protein EOP06_21425 [Proteobacteria bacterium]|nr:MAG: hypothetical protein EOP06_21425 [Pseudomonadota bacterium]
MSSVRTPDALNSGVEISDTQLIEVYRAQLERLSGLCASIGISRPAYLSKELPHFQKLSSEAKIAAVTSIQFFLKICEEATASGEQLMDTKRLTWRALRHFGFVPSEDLFSTMTEDTIVEVYNTDNIQVFRNFEFFKFCSYTLEDTFCRPWPELFRRPDPFIAKAVQDRLTEVLNTGSRSLVPSGISSHVVEEIDSLRLNRMMLEIRDFAALYDKQNQLAGYIALERAHFIS